MISSPTVRDIIKNLGYSYATVNRTLIEMEQEGLITKRQGKGVFVDRSVPQVSVKEVSLIIPKGFSSHKIFLERSFRSKAPSGKSKNQPYCRNF